MDLASQKSAAGRTGALDAICRAFCKKYIPDFVDDRRVTLTDIVERAVKKGKGSEIVSGCNLCILLCLQLDSVDYIQEVFKDLKSIFVTLLNDASVGPAARSAIAHAYAMTCFLAVDEGEAEDVMRVLEKIFLANPTAHQVSMLQNIFFVETKQVRVVLVPHILFLEPAVRPFSQSDLKLDGDKYSSAAYFTPVTEVNQSVFVPEKFLRSPHTDMSTARSLPQGVALG